jgi:hypothetical protein
MDCRGRWPALFVAGQDHTVAVLLQELNGDAVIYTADMQLEKLAREAAIPVEHSLDTGESAPETVETTHPGGQPEVRDKDITS